MKSQCLICHSSLEIENCDIFDSQGRLPSIVSGNSQEPILINLYRCATCKLIQKCFTDSQLNDLLQVYKHNYKTFDISDDDRIKKMVNTILDISTIQKKYNKQQSLEILDIGCGDGSLLKIFTSEAKANNINIELNAMDLTENNLDAIKNIQYFKNFYYGWEELNAGEHKFDIITANMVLEHAFDPVVFLKQLAKNLDKNGIIAIRIPNPYLFPSDLFIYEHTGHYSRTSIEFLVRVSGLSILDWIVAEDSSSHTVLIGKQQLLTKGPEDKLLDSYFNYDDNFNISDVLIDFKRWINLIIKFKNSRKVGVFGINGAGGVLARIMPNEVDYIFDEDKAKFGILSLPVPCFFDQPPSGSVMILTYRNLVEANRISEDLIKKYPMVEVIY